MIEKQILKLHENERLSFINDGQTLIVRLERVDSDNKVIFISEQRAFHRSISHFKDILICDMVEHVFQIFESANKGKVNDSMG